MWGIPVPAFYRKGKASREYLLKPDIVEHVRAKIEKEGSEVWYREDIESLLPEKYRKEAKDLEKETEVFNVWFESGCSWYSVLKKGVDLDIGNLKSIAGPDSKLIDAGESEAEILKTDLVRLESQVVQPGENKKEEPSANIEGLFPCSMIVQGADQHDGWLQSSSLISRNSVFSLQIFLKK